MAGRILIADSVSTNRIMLRTKLAGAAYATQQASTAAETVAMARAEPPDVILLPDELTDSDGLALCQRLRRDPRLARTPIALMTTATHRDQRMGAIRAGIDAILEVGVSADLLRARMRNLMRRSAAQSELRRAVEAGDGLGFAEASAAGFTRPGQIALIADGLGAGLKWRNGLTAQMRDRIAVLDPQSALQDIDDEPIPDAIVVAQNPEAPEDCLHLITDLKCRSDTMRALIVLVQTAPDPRSMMAALDLGVDDVLQHGFDAEEMSCILRRELSRKASDDTRRAYLENGVRLAATDPLTGLYNRRSALRQMENLAEKADRQGEKFAVMVLDIDRFKSINDRFGHAVGDAVLIEVADRLNRTLRRGDFVARIGGEEFLAVMRIADPNSAMVAAERLRAVISEAPVQISPQTQPIDVTMSIGLVIAGTDAASGSPAELIDLADRGLYAAKAEGRNQVTLYQSAA